MALVAADLPMPALQGVNARLMIVDGIGGRLEASFIMTSPAIDNPSSESRLSRMGILVAGAATLESGFRSPCTLRIVTVSARELVVRSLQRIACLGMVEFLRRHDPEILDDVTVGACSTESAFMRIDVTIRTGLKGHRFETWNRKALCSGHEDASLYQMAFFTGDGGMLAGQCEH
jgi:hypothetical protein